MIGFSNVISTWTAYLVSIHFVTAGGLNVVNLVHGGDLVVNVKFDSTNQNLIVKSKEYSGSFGVPETEVTLATALEGATDLEVPANDDSFLAVFQSHEGGFKWSLVPSKPSEEKWALRIVNLSTLTLPILADGDELLELKPESDTAQTVENKGDIRLKIDKAETFTYKGNDPCAVVALVYRETEQWKVVFVPEF